MSRGRLHTPCTILSTLLIVPLFERYSLPCKSLVSRFTFRFTSACTFHPRAARSINTSIKTARIITDRQSTEAEHSPHPHEFKVPPPLNRLPPTSQHNLFHQAHQRPQSRFYSSTTSTMEALYQPQMFATSQFEHGGHSQLLGSHHGAPSTATHHGAASYASHPHEIPDWLAFQFHMSNNANHAHAHAQQQQQQQHTSTGQTFNNYPSPLTSSPFSDGESDFEPTPATLKFPLMFGEGQFVPAHFAAPPIDFKSQHISSPRTHLPPPPSSIPPALTQTKLVVPKTECMTPFPSDQVSDFKHVIYNLLADYHNHPERAATAFVQPLTIEENGQIRHGFMFNQKQNPEKRLPELYALHIRKAKLELEDPNSIFIQDLYKFYLRASLELLSKYFEKRGKYMFLYEDQPLFSPGTSLEEAEDRIRNMRTRARMQKKRKNN
ncbi:hypothetical protein PROFUN_12867 [Planoprotostelium fungivorum]|uniref:Uncharacterized protein n=1 Tax=Planoprotostelium fungivorum TaxID=1890364 RepID=A0A2P6N6C3_9EUKA|nr:hypothetical protein PROFUN_12867 [Planoprotostelium fungivorum]